MKLTLLGMGLSAIGVVVGAITLVAAHTAPNDNATAILAAQGFYSDVTAVPCGSVPAGTPVSAYAGTPVEAIGTMPAHGALMPICRW